MTSKTLVVGGTGPTGPAIVAGLEARGHDVTICHTGSHEVDEVMHLPHIHAIHLAVDQPEAAAGRIFNAADEEALTVRQVVEICASALGAELEIVSMPAELAVPARPLMMGPSTHHRVFDISALRHVLGYRDVVSAREAVARTARWLVENPHPAGGQVERILEDPFDYENEDRLISWWKSATATPPDLVWETPPGYGLSYSGPGTSYQRPDTRI